MFSENPWATVDCHYCDGKGCECPGHLGKHLADCQPCGPCDATGQLFQRELNEMAKSYRADERFKRAWKSAE